MIPRTCPAIACRPLPVPSPLQAPRPRRRLAVVVQRYGDDVAGGAEAHARSFVQAVAPVHEVTVLTSRARDAATWAPAFPAGDDVVDGVAVRRFDHPPRNAEGRARVPRRHKLRLLAARWLDALGRPRVAMPGGDDELDGHRFLRRQGPACDGLVDALRRNAGGWEAAVFFTALYHPTAEGLPAWGPRSVLVPTLHDEKPMYLPWFHRVFAAAGQVLWNTAAEQRLARRLYGASAPQGTVVGAPVQVRPPDAAAMAAARAAHGLPARYVVYVGRIERGKGCADLLAAWQAVAAQVPDAALVFIGRGAWPVPQGPQVKRAGFLGAAERDAIVAGAHALVMPSRHESLSLVLLEAMALGVPVLANARCEPLADHVQGSGAGEAYHDAAGLRAGLLRALARPAPDRERLGEAGRAYVAAHYAAPVVQAAWLDAVERAAQGGA